MIHLFPVERVAFLLENLQRGEFVRANLRQGDRNAEVEGGFDVERTPEQEADRAVLCGVEFIERACIAASAILRGIRTQARLA
jgi:hypothetical protein